MTGHPGTSPSTATANTETSCPPRFATGASSRREPHLGPRSPWQNGIAERWVQSVRRELLDHVVVMGANHLRRLLTEYVDYYNEDRCHLSLDKDTPDPRDVTPRPSPAAKVVALPRVGGLHHRYEWTEVRRAA